MLPPTIPVLPPQELVTLRSKTGEGSYQDTPGVLAQRSVMEAIPVEGQRGKRVNRVIWWRIWTPDLDAVDAPAPKIGDILVDDAGASYVVGVADNGLAGDVWNLESIASSTAPSVGAGQPASAEAGPSGDKGK